MPEVSPKLPELRQELTLQQVGFGHDGSQSWIVVDPVQHRYIAIDPSAHSMLTKWRAGASYQEFISELDACFGLHLEADDIEAFVRFLQSNNLTVEPEKGGWLTYWQTAQGGQHGAIMWMVHNYLFIKVPLFRPEHVLQRFAPFVAPLFSRRMLAIILCTGLCGLYLVSRQWAVFAGTFQHFYSWQGAAIYALALMLIKSAHELGHAFTAQRYGCRVPSMGVCFLVLFPVLYTDVSDAWKLRDKRERLAIGGAGMAVEIAIACVATFLWSFLPEGTAKSLAFSFATVGWVLSLGVNLNPLMRFDGYYLLSDALQIGNLQSRAFAFGQWRLRELLFGLGNPPPEPFARTTARILIAYAWIIWIYRLVVFTGIAVLVYHMAFKILGIILFLVEIIYFIARPIYSEVMRWWSERNQIILSRRSAVTAMIAVFLLTLFFIPWSSRIQAPAVLEAAGLTRVFPDHAGIVSRVAVKAGATVKQGDVLIQMQSPDLDQRMSLTRKKLELVKMRLARRSADGIERDNSLSLEQELAALLSEVGGLEREKQEMAVRAPISGVIAEWNPAVHEQRQLSRAEPIALLRGHGGLVARGYIQSKDVDRIAPGAAGTFVPEEIGAERLQVMLHDISRSGVATVDIPELASVHGGPLAVRPHSGGDSRKRLVPVEAAYMVILMAEDRSVQPGSSLRGVVELDGHSESLAHRFWRQVAGILVRESGL